MIDKNREKKICNKCNVEKDVKEFYKDKSQPDGHSYACKECELTHKKYLYHQRAARLTPEAQATVREKTTGKICTTCGEFKLWDEYGSRRGATNGASSACSSCGQKRAKVWRHSAAKFRDTFNASSMDPNEFLNSLPMTVNPLNKCIQSTRIRARKRGMEHTITYKDIFPIPTICPLLGISIFYTLNTISDNSPSIDRIDSTKGYTPDNVWVISNRANRLKSDISIEEMELLVTNLKLKLKR